MKMARSFAGAGNCVLRSVPVSFAGSRNLGHNMLGHALGWVLFIAMLPLSILLCVLIMITGNFKKVSAQLK